jgi:hypothetical protein
MLLHIACAQTAEHCATLANGSLCGSLLGRLLLFGQLLLLGRLLLLLFLLFLLFRLLGLLLLIN